MMSARSLWAGLIALGCWLGCGGEEVVRPECSGDWVRTQIQQARAALKAREYPRAIELCAEVLTANPTCAEAAGILASAAEKKNSAESRGVNATASERDAHTLIGVDKDATPPAELCPAERPQLPRRDTVAELERYKPASEILKQPVSADFQDANLDWVLSTLFLTSGVNIVADPAAIKDKKLTLHVNNMPLEDVLDFIVRNNDGIQFSVNKGSIWITATDNASLKKLMFSRIYPLHFGLLSMKTGSGMDATSKPAASSAPAPNGSRYGSSRGTSPAAASPATPAGAEGGDDKGSYLEAVLEWYKANKDPEIFPEGSSYLVDRQSNQIIVYTTPSGHQHILDVLDHFDQPAIQVLIQTRFLDISDELERDIGLNLESANTRTDNKRNPFHALNISSLPGFLPGAPGLGSTFSFIGRRTDPQFTVTLEALLNDKKTKVLSQPQILAVNNKESMIDISTEFDYIEALDPIVQQIPAGLGSVVPQQSGYTPRFNSKDVGFKLGVTPSIGRDLKHINLHLTPLIDSLAQGQQISDFQNVTINTNTSNSSTPLTFPKPTIDKTKCETDVTIEDNGYVVIGGLVQKFEEVRNRKIPGLSQIPVIGQVFKSTSKNMRRRNLMIIVEAHIITPDGKRYGDGK